MKEEGRIGDGLVPLRKLLLENILKQNPSRADLVLNEIVTVVDGPYAHIGLKVEAVKDNVVTLCIPESSLIQVSRSQVWTFKKYKTAFKEAYKQYPDDVLN